MGKKNKTRDYKIPDNVKVDPEETKKRLESLPYKVVERPSVKPPKKGLLWCCYCAQWSNFKKDTTGYYRSDCCGISTEDFYIKRHNNLW